MYLRYSALQFSVCCDSCETRLAAGRERELRDCFCRCQDSLPAFISSSSKQISCRWANTADLFSRATASSRASASRSRSSAARFSARRGSTGRTPRSARRGNPSLAAGHVREAPQLLSQPHLRGRMHLKADNELSVTPESSQPVMSKQISRARRPGTFRQQCGFQQKASDDSRKVRN